MGAQVGGVRVHAELTLAARVELVRVHAYMTLAATGRMYKHGAGVDAIGGDPD